MPAAEFILEHPSGLRISRHLKEAEVAVLEGVVRREAGADCLWYTLPPFASGGMDLVVSLYFFRGRLGSLNLAPSDPGTGGSGWDAWSEKCERKSAELAKGWLKAMGYRTGTHAWGEVWAGYDAKSGWGGGTVRYLKV